MSNMKIDEMYILKAVSIKLDPETILIATFQYHTEKGNRAASRYRWLARVEKIQDLQNKIRTLKQDENRLNPWYWPDDPSWTGKIYYTDSDNYHRANWIRSKINKAVDWDLGVRLLQGYNKTTKKFDDVKRYDTTDYSVQGNPDQTVNLTDREALLKLAGKNLFKEQVKKSKDAIHPENDMPID